MQMKVSRLQDAQFSFDPADFEDCEEILLEPGSVLYFPAGVWHRVECEEDSVSINISLVSSNWADLISDSIKTLLWVLPNPSNSPRPRPLAPHDNFIV